MPRTVLLSINLLPPGLSEKCGDFGLSSKNKSKWLGILGVQITVDFIKA